MADFNTINQGLDVTGRVLDTADYKKWLNLILTITILLVFIFLLLYIVKHFAGNFIGSFWDFITTPFKNTINQYEAYEETGVRATISNSKAKEIADSIDSCFTLLDDDEDSLYTILEGKIKNAADWELVKEAFGTRSCNCYNNILPWLHSGNLEHVISSHLNSSERAQVRQILNSKGVTYTSI